MKSTNIAKEFHVVIASERSERSNLCFRLLRRLRLLAMTILGVIFLSVLFSTHMAYAASSGQYRAEAKKMMERARERIADTRTQEGKLEVDVSEKQMANQILEKQIIPYLEPPPREEIVSLSPLVEPPPLRKKLKDKKITLDFDKVDLKSVVAFISQDSGVNIVLSQKVLDLGLKISVRFKDGTIEDVLKYITKSQGLVSRIDRDIVWIAHPEEVANEQMETRIYRLNRGGGIFTEFSSSSLGSSGSPGETSLGGSSSQIGKILTLADTLKAAVSWPGDAKLVYDRRIDALIVRNTPQNLQALEDMLYTLDVTPCQVLIEARFMEVDITDTEELGIEWKLLQDFPLNKDRRGQTVQNFAKNSGADFTNFANVSEGFNMTYQGLLSKPQVQMILHAFAKNSKIKTLSSPRITTLNNQMATLKVVDEWIYPTRYEFEIYQTDPLDPATTTYVNVPKDFIRRDVGILLKVLPSVGADKKTITLSLIPEVSEGVKDAFTYVGDVKLPKFTSRNLSTTIMVDSGDTVVMGGMIKESRTHTLTKVPIIGDIPLLGLMFRKNSDTIRRRNLLIFITAKLLSPSGEEIVVAHNK